MSNPQGVTLHVLGIRHKHLSPASAPLMTRICGCDCRVSLFPWVSSWATVWTWIGDHHVLFSLFFPSELFLVVLHLNMFIKGHIPTSTHKYTKQVTCTQLNSSLLSKYNKCLVLWVSFTNKWLVLWVSFTSNQQFQKNVFGEIIQKIRDYTP